MWYNVYFVRFVRCVNEASNKPNEVPSCTNDKELQSLNAGIEILMRLMVWNNFIAIRFALYSEARGKHFFIFYSQ